jgi:charged multivesicular body protein 4A/B
MRLFGSSGGKKKTAEGPKESILQMRSTLEMLEKKEKHLDTKIQQETDFARSHASSNKNQALMALKRRKQYEIQQENIRGARFNLETQIMTIENAHINLETLQAMKSGSAAMKSIHGELDVDKVDDVMEEVREQMDLANEISTAISNPLGIDSSIDEDELEAELERFEQEALDATLLETTKVPIISTANPQATAVKSTSSLSNLAKSSSQPILNDEDAELEELRASMAL